MNVIAKFKCDANEPIEGEQHRIVASPVTTGSDENKSFSRWTPAGKLELIISDETEAGKFFKVGEEFYMTFSKERQV